MQLAPCTLAHVLTDQHTHARMLAQPGHVCTHTSGKHALLQPFPALKLQGDVGPGLRDARCTHSYQSKTPHEGHSAPTAAVSVRIREQHPWVHGPTANTPQAVLGQSSPPGPFTCPCSALTTALARSTWLQQPQLFMVIAELIIKEMLDGEQKGWDAAGERSACGGDGGGAPSLQCAPTRRASG